MMSDFVRVEKNEGEGYWPAITFDGWIAAFLNYAERFDINNLYDVERHNLSDEVFGLIAGEAYLIIAGDASEPSENVEVIKMEKGPMYDVKKGVWHHIVTSKDASTFIVENSNTSSDNSEMKPLSKSAVEYVKSVVKL